MSTVNNSTDKVLIHRSGTNYSTLTDMSTVNNTDLLIVNRNGTDYKCTYADWAASQTDEPAIQSLTVAEADTTGARFTSKTFNITYAMDDDGNPTSTKAFKARVLKPDNGPGNFPQLDYLMKFSGITAVSTSGSQVTVTLADSTNLDLLNVGDTVRPLNATLSPDWAATSTFSGNANWTTAFDGGGTGGQQSYWYPGSAISFDTSVVICGGESGYDDKYVAGAWGNSGWVRSNGGCQTLRSGASTLTQVGLRDHRGSTVGGSIGEIQLDGHTIRRNVYNPCGVVASINTSTNQVVIDNGDSNQGSTLANWTANGNPVLCREYDIANSKRAATEIFNNGRYQGPRIAEQLYCTFGVDGSITDFVPGDPGWVTTTAQSGTITLTFPANATNQACDTDFPSGSRIVVEMRATNTHGTAYITSNTLTPA